MSKISERPANTDLYARIEQTRMTALEREVAINALRDADAISDGIMWVVNVIENAVKYLSNRAPLKHGFKH
jgi:hypothetical protein